MSHSKRPTKAKSKAPSTMFSNLSSSDFEAIFASVKIHDIKKTRLKKERAEWKAQHNEMVSTAAKNVQCSASDVPKIYKRIRKTLQKLEKHHFVKLPKERLKQLEKRLEDPKIMKAVLEKKITIFNAMHWEDRLLRQKITSLYGVKTPHLLFHGKSKSSNAASPTASSSAGSKQKNASSHSSSVQLMYKDQSGATHPVIDLAKDDSSDDAAYLSTT